MLLTTEPFFHPYFMFSFIYVCVHMSLGAQGSQRPLIFFLAGILAACELPSVGFGNQNLVLVEEHYMPYF